MSLNFQIDLAFDIKSGISEEVISTLKLLSKRQSINIEQKKLIPKILEEILTTESNLLFFGKDIFYFDKQYRYTSNQKDMYKWTFHLRTMYSDDIFYEYGYSLIAWLSTISETYGFVGYYKEEFENEPNLIFFENETVVIRNNSKKETNYKYSDFN